MRPLVQCGRRYQAFLAPAAALLPAAVALVGLTLLGFSPVSADSPTPSRESRTVTIENMQFTPQTLTVHRGERVVWVNKDLFPHTVTASGKAFDSHGIAPNASWTLVARKSGQFSYVCSFHPTMTGTLVVQ